jgi:hypothetical protein
LNSIAPRQDLQCELCARPAAQQHHILHRSLGGGDDEHNQLRVCESCHAKLHPEKFGGYGLQVIENSDSRVAVVDRKTGELAFERWLKPDGFTVSRVTTLLSESSQAIRISSAYFKYLTPDEIREVYDQLKEMDTETWAALGRLLLVAKLQMPYGNRVEKFNALVQDLGIKKSHGYKLVAALEIVDKTPEFQGMEKLPPPDAILLAVSKDDPVAAIELYQDRAANNQRYSIAQYKEDLRLGTDSLQQEPQYHHCPDCGQLHVRRADIPLEKA